MQGSYLSCPSFREVRVLIYLVYLKYLRVSGGTIKKNFRFSSLILLVYSLSPSRACFTTYMAWRASSSPPLTFLVRSELGSFLDFLSSQAYKVRFSRPVTANWNISSWSQSSVTCTSSGSKFPPQSRFFITYTSVVNFFKTPLRTKYIIS